MGLVSSLLAGPRFYRLFQAVWGGTNSRKQFLSDFAIQTQDKKILDIGCGVGEVLSYIAPSCDYQGFDGNAEYIAYAQKRFPKSHFHSALVSEETLKGEGQFDIVLALGIIHHLDDHEADLLLEMASKALKVGGQFVAFDGVFIENQSPLDRYFVKKDRGQFIREKFAYETLIRRRFPKIQTRIYSREFYLPYTAIGAVCTKE